MLEKVVISNPEKDLITHFIAFAPALLYCLISNSYLLIKAFEIQTCIKKNGDKIESDILYSLFFRSNFWNEASALCTDRKLQKVFKIRIAIYIIWIPLVIASFILSGALTPN